VLWSPRGQTERPLNNDEDSCKTAAKSLLTMVAKGEVKIAAAMYDLASGVV